jgi:mRNA interferase RelE/StbE
MFSISVGKKPAKAIRDLEPKFKQKIKDALDMLQINPWPAREYDLSKIEGLEDCFRIRIGDYRVCYHVNTDIKEITVYRFERKSDTTYK